MPANRTSLRVTDAYRQRMLAIRRDGERMARETWADVDPEDLAGTYKVNPLADGVGTLQRTGVLLSQAYVTAFIKSEIGTKVLIPTPRGFAGTSFDDVKLRFALWRPVVLVRQLLDQGVGQTEAMRRGRNTLLTSVSLATDGAVRDSLTKLYEKQPEIVGWRRAVKGTCELCMGAADGSTLPPGTPLDIHPNCECVSEAVISGMRYDAPANAAAERTVRELGYRFPKVEGRFRMLPEVRAHQLGGNSFDGVHVSDQFFDDAFMADWAKEFRIAMVGDLRTVASARESVITHEMGHFLEKSLADVNRAAWDELHAFVNEPVTYDVGGKSVTAPRWQAGIPSETPSAYANESPYEFIAEGFDDYIHNGAKAKAASKRIGKLIEDNLGR